MRPRSNPSRDATYDTQHISKDYRVLEDSFATRPGQPSAASENRDPSCIACRIHRQSRVKSHSVQNYFRF